MKKLSKNILIASAVAAAAISAPSIATHVWGNANGTYHWDGQSLPVQISVIDSVDTSWQTEMETTIVKWNASTALNLAVNSVDDSSSARTSCAVTNGQMRICNAAYGTTDGWLGLASLDVDADNHVLYGTAKVNDSYTMTQDEKNGVMCQEVGHLFGLGHTSTDGSSQGTCMDYSSNPSDGVWPNAHDYTLLEEIYAHIDGTVVTGLLTNGQAKTNLTAATGAETPYYIDIPAGASNLSFTISGGSGDADLYVKYNAAPTTGSYDCRPYKNGNSESCSFATPSTGRYYVMLQAYAGYSNLTLTASYSVVAACVAGNGVLCNGVTEANVTSSTAVNYSIDVPVGASNLSFDLTGGSGDADLYVKFGSAPTTGSYDCRSWNYGNTENCSFATASTGNYYVMVNAYSAFSGANLTVTYSGAAAIADYTGTGTVAVNSVAKYSKHGVRVAVHGRSETWMKRNIDGTTTLTYIYLAGENNQAVEIVE
jgi:pre-peptidase